MKQKYFFKNIINVVTMITSIFSFISLVIYISNSPFLYSIFSDLPSLIRKVSMLWEKGIVIDLGVKTTDFLHTKSGDFFFYSCKGFKFEHVVIRKIKYSAYTNDIDDFEYEFEFIINMRPKGQISTKRFFCKIEANEGFYEI